MADHNVPAQHGHGGEHGEHVEHAEDHGHHVSIWTFVGVFIALLVLTIISFATANLVQPPQVAWAIMMAVSCAKALLVITFFMHLIWEASWKYVLTIPASIMSIFLVVMLVPDVGRRTSTYSEERWRFAAEPQSVQEVVETQGSQQEVEHDAH